MRFVAEQWRVSKRYCTGRDFFYRLFSNFESRTIQVFQVCVN